MVVKMRVLTAFLLIAVTNIAWSDEGLVFLHTLTGLQYMRLNLNMDKSADNTHTNEANRALWNESAHEVFGNQYISEMTMEQAITEFGSDFVLGQHYGLLEFNISLKKCDDAWDEYILNTTINLWDLMPVYNTNNCFMEVIRWSGGWYGICSQKDLDLAINDCILQLVDDFNAEWWKANPNRMTENK